MLVWPAKISLLSHCQTVAHGGEVVVVIVVVVVVVFSFARHSFGLADDSTSANHDDIQPYWATVGTSKDKSA